MSRPRSAGPHWFRLDQSTANNKKRFSVRVCICGVSNTHYIKFRSTTLTSMSSLHGAEWPLLFLLTVTDEWKAMMWLSAPVLVKPSNMCGLNNYWFSIFCTAFIYPMDYSSMAAVPLSVLQDFYRNCSGCCIYNCEQHLVYIFGKNSGLEVL